LTSLTWRPLLFSKTTRDPVAPAKRSASALAEAKTKKTAEGFEAPSFRTLMDRLGTIVRNFRKRIGIGTSG
jgi:hypothetical protein